MHWITGECTVRMHVNMWYELMTIVWLTEWHESVRLAQHGHEHGCHEGTKQLEFMNGPLFVFV